MTKRIAAILMAGTAFALAGCAVTPPPAASVASVPAQARDPLMAGFRDPPNAARPRVWWHWMNGNVTKDGIAKDLAWMKQVGIGGMQNFDANLDTPQVVDKRLVYMTPEWKDAFAFAASEADRLGLELAIAASPGWSETGGPWVAPKDGMKKLVWSETVLPGGRRFTGELQAPPDRTGLYQTVGDGSAAGPKASGQVAVLAVPTAAQELPAPRVSLADGTVLDPKVLSDADLTTGAKVPVSADLTGQILIDYARPVTVRSLQIFMPGLKSPFRGVLMAPVFEANVDGSWQQVKKIEVTEVPGTFSFPPVRAKNFRIRLLPNPDQAPGLDLNGAPGALTVDFFASGPLTAVEITDLRVSGEQMVDRAEEKAGFETAPDYYAIGSRDASPVSASPGDVIDLTDRVRPDGTLDWTPPAGKRWRVLNFGWSLLGTTNHPATPEATGLEVDKYDAAAVRAYLEHYLAMYEGTTKGVDALLTDSIEVGDANWTPAMEAEFQRLHGYALRPWLPALTGIVLGSPAQTEKFLYDFRSTLAVLLAERHYATVATVAHEHGLKLYGEALEDKRPMLGDDLAMRRHTDIPMAALWTWPKGGSVRTTLLGDMKGAASVAHVYGKPFVAAESMTAVNSPWAFAPRDLKTFIDLEFAMGINRPVIHTSVHQPLDKGPGLSLAIFGQYFNRNETWAGMARPWVDYISRSAYLLQQGHYHADIAWFTGEERPVTGRFATSVPDGLPTRYGYDFVDAGMLRDGLRAENGELVAADGNRYRALDLSWSDGRMTLATLRRVAEIARAGVLVTGAKPAGSPSLADDPAEFSVLADQVWSLPNVSSSSPEQALVAHGVAADFALEGGQEGKDVLFLHRTLDDGEIYFLSNRSGRAMTLSARFRVTGRAPELFDPATGSSRPLSYTTENGATVVPLQLTDNGSAFVVFRQSTAAVRAEHPLPQDRDLDVTFAPWQVTFQDGRGAPAGITLTALAPLNESADPGVRYFSGVATYRTTFTVLAGTDPKALTIDLGEVGDVAEVYVNGALAGTALFSPNRVPIGQWAKPGPNALEVRVADLWVNRLIGDKQPGAKPIAFTTAPTYRPDAPLRRSGLIGPVRLLAEQ